MKKVLSVFLVLTMVMGLFTGCAQKDVESNKQENNSSSETIKVAIVQPVEHPSLNEIRESITSSLEEKMKDKVEVIYKNAQGDGSNIKTIMSQLVGDKVDYIVPIGTGTAQLAAAATKDIPIVFSAVSYPVEAGLVSSYEDTTKNITGVADVIPVDQILDLAAQLTNNLKTIGFIYNSGEDNSIANIKKAKEYCDKNNIEYFESTISNSSELLQASQSMSGKVDAIFAPNDNTVAPAMATLAAEAIKMNIPVYTGADSMVADGGFATVGINYTLLGQKTADMIIRLINGNKISETPVEAIKDYSKMINKNTMEKLNITVDSDIMKQLTIIE